jgi:superfamily II DNA or RNA helicase
MSGWTEATLRAAASWKAFKEGKALFEAGVVTEARADHDGWRGAVRAGKRLIRVRVMVKSVTDLETRCSCPENQASGELCGHAVAAGLAALAGGMAASTHEVSVSTPSPPVPASLPWRILLPLNWREALARGHCAATLELAPDGEIFPADDRLNAWLAGQGVVAKAILTLNPTAGRVSSFLDAIADHPRIAAGKDRHPLAIRAGERFRLAAVTLLGDVVRLIPQQEAAAWIEIDRTFWQISEDSLTRAGEGSMPADLAIALSEISRGRPVDIPANHFLNHLAAWQEWIAFPADCWLDSLHFIPAPVVIELALEGSLQHLEARIQVKYANAPAVPPGTGTIDGLPRLSPPRCEIRNQAAEQQAMARLAMAGFQPQDEADGRWLLNGESAILDFLTRTLPLLRSQWSVTEGVRFAHLRQQVTVVSPIIDILGSGGDWLSFTLSFQADDGTVVPSSEVRRLLRAGKSSGKSTGGRHLVISEDLENLVDPLFADLDLRQENGRYLASARSGEIVREIRGRIAKSQTVGQAPIVFPFTQPASLHAELRPYQRLGAAWLLDRVTRFGGALLADDMGLGKTLQAIALIECLLSEPASEMELILVIATASLLGNWRAEFARFAPARRVHVLHGAGRDAARDRLVAGDVILTSYGTLARDLAWHLRRDYRAVVVDEASLMRNPDTDHAKAIAKLHACHRIALTGTPVENGVRDLWSVFRFIQPGWLGGREEFRDRYELPLAGGESAAGVMERLKLKTHPFLLRRTKEQVAPELPTKLFIDEFCDLSPDQQTVYHELLLEGRRRVDAIADSGNPAAARMQLLTALLRLRQTCCDLALFSSERFNRLLVARRSAKLHRLLELLEEAVSGNHRVLVFSQFQKQLVEIEKCVVEREWGCLRLDGQTRNRHQMVEAFQQPNGPPVFLISLKAGGYGLNLTAADTVIHFDPWWNPAAEMQATDRAHRIGQTRPVTVYRLLTRGTVEEKVIRMQARKRELAASIDESGTGDAVGWNMEDLKAVIAGD